MTESSFINKINNSTFKQNMPTQYCADITNQLYNNWIFEGEKIENISNIDEYILRTNI